MFCGDMVFWLLLTPCESAWGPDFCLKELPILRQLGRVGASCGTVAGGATVGMEERLGKDGTQIRGEIHYF